MTFNKLYLFLVALCAVALALLGCNKGGGGGSRAGLVKAGGVVMYNGQPVEGAVVEMRPATPGSETAIAIGRTDAQGRFAMMTDRPGDGALPGVYKTVVKKQVEMIDGITRDEYVSRLEAEGKEATYDKEKIKIENLTPAKYADPLNTPLEIEIPEKGDKNIQITLED